ncbi:ribbon-helix-helix domain-containing protein [Bifidobacterium longum]|uniref:ribbon-helix-helix domain-containing protein n=1 Tax=Bifidobacterium longum TaxID=216816 RepID=UPI0023ED747D|nr:ribbon-helix-helix domain-containing protein [Bifidobacterium longum]MDF4082720.1 ribbon-helix-helix domain-containing protein [Bifidobacterium longum]
MRRYSHAFRVLMDQELFNLLAEASTKTGIPKSRFVRYAIQPFSYTELAPGTTDWNDVYRTDPDPEHPLKQGRQLNVMLTGDEYEMLCRAAFKLGIARSAWVRERVYALLCRSYADELSPLTDASIRDNATMLLKELKTKDTGR